MGAGWHHKELVMVITPSATGSILSGGAFWTIFWSIVNHVNDIPIIGRFVNKDKIYGWVNKNKVLTLTSTEVVNFGIHGVSNPLGVMMAAGGTVINTIVIMALIPLRQKRKERKEAGHLILGV
jgi:hypothetical protein